jgi:autotransporter-associated beta strand protein
VKAPSLSTSPRLRIQWITCCLAWGVTVAALRAQQTITYNPDETNSTAYVITTPQPGDVTTLNLASGAATQSGAFSGSGYLTKYGAGNLTVTGNSAPGIRFSAREGTLTLAPVNPAAMQGNAYASGNTFLGMTGTLVIAPPNNTPLGIAYIDVSSGGVLQVSTQRTTALSGTTVSFFGGNAQLPDGTVLGGLSGFNNATLTAAASYAGGGPAYSSTITFGANNQNTSSYGTLRAGDNVGLNLQKVGTGTWTFEGALGSYSTLEIQAGKVNLNAPNANLKLAGGTVSYGSGVTHYGSIYVTATSTIDTPSDVTLNTSFSSVYGSVIQLNKTGSGTLTLNGFNSNYASFNVTAGALALSDQYKLGYSATLTLNGGTLRATESFTGTQATTLGSNGGTFDVAGSDRALTWNGALTGSGTLTKTGAGSLTLSGTNTYAGATAVNVGTLIVNGSLADTALAIANGATLGGSGTIGGPTTFNSGSHLAPGNSPGTLTFTNGLTLTQGAILDFQLGTTSDLIRVSGGTLTGPGVVGGVTINLSDAGGFGSVAEGTPFTVINFSGASTASFATTYFTLGTVIPGTNAADYVFGLSGSTLTLTYGVSAIPEPSTYAALFGALALGLAAWRRRKHQS